MTFSYRRDPITGSCAKPDHVYRNGVGYARGIQQIDQIALLLEQRAKVVWHGGTYVRIGGKQFYYAHLLKVQAVRRYQTAERRKSFISGLVMPKETE